jgi:hypothetical protein
VIARLIGEGEAAVLEDREGIAGFSFFRRFGRGHVIGPVIARDDDAARVLIAHWIASNPGEFVRIDLAGQAGLSDWLEGLGLARVSSPVVMRRGEPVMGNGAMHCFALVNQALG